MNNMLVNELGFEKYTTNKQLFYCGWLPEGDCIEVIFGNNVEINYVNAKNNYAKLTQFKKDVDVKFLKRYLTSLILVLDREDK